MGSLLRSLWSPRSQLRDIETIDDYIEAVSSMGFGLGGQDFSLSALTGTMGRQQVERVAADF